MRRDAAAPRDLLRDALQRALPSHLSIVRPLGRGGMGAVYLARDEFLDRDVAIKTLPAELDTNDALRERFRREARIAAKLHHPNIVPLHTFGEAENILYYVMGYVPGETLAQWLGRDGTIDPDNARRILAEIADALRYANGQTVIHRDLKPENILIEDSTRTAFLADFGIARLTSGGNLTRAGAVLGTPLYMSPEQAIGGEVDHRSDIYSLGVIGYRMLTGRFPVAGETFTEMLAQHAARKPQPVSEVNPAVPPDLNDAIMRCLEKDPQDRWQTAAELRQILVGSLAEAAEDTPEMQSAGVYLLLFSWIALLFLPFEIFYWPQIDYGWRLLIQLIQCLPLFGVLVFAVRVSEARKDKMPWPAVWRSVFHPPRWYWGWTPRWLRPHGDVWDRLPRVIRIYRNLFTAAVLFAPVLILSLPITYLSGKGTVVKLAAGSVWVVFIPTVIAFVLAQRFARTLGIRDERQLVTALHGATWLLGKTRNPAIAKLFTNPTPRPEGAGVVSPGPPPAPAAADPEETPTRKEDFATSDAGESPADSQSSTVAKV